MCRVALWQRTFLLKWPTEVVLLFFNCVNYFRHIIVIFSFFIGVASHFLLCFLYLRAYKAAPDLL